MKYLKQFLIILVISYAGELLKYVLPLPIPATTTARVLGTSLAGLMPWRMLTIVLLVSAAACTAARLAVLLTGMTHHLVVVSVGFAVYLSLYLPFAQRAGICYMELFGPVLAKLRPNRT